VEIGRNGGKTGNFDVNNMADRRRRIGGLLLLKTALPPEAALKPLVAAQKPAVKACAIRRHSNAPGVGRIEISARLRQTAARKQTSEERRGDVA